MRPAETLAFSFMRGILFRDWIEAENAEELRRAVDFSDSSFELGVRFGYHIEKELIHPGSAMNRAAFDLHQVDAVTGKGLEGSEERSGFMRQT